jgi:hypothetical protein
LSLGEIITNRFVQILKNYGYISQDTNAKDLVNRLSKEFNFDFDDWPDFRRTFDIDATEADILEDETLVRYFGARASHLV